MIARGCVLEVGAGLLHARVPTCVAIGDGVRVCGAAGALGGRVVALADGKAVISMYGDVSGIDRSAVVESAAGASALPLGACALGRAFDALGDPLDGGPPLRGRMRDVQGASPAPSERAELREPLWTGIRALDGLLTSAQGARVGIFGAPGTGKSELMRAIAARAQADTVVVGLIGERGREAEAWIRTRSARTTVVCATGDRAAAERVRAAEIAFAQADAMRERGLHVLLVMDSIARYAGALRELAVASGEPVGRAGFPAGVFAQLARTLERAGPTHTGSISLLATVLDDGDARDPISDAARSMLDGHVVLSSMLAQAGHFPAIDVPASSSRTMDAVASPEHAHLASRARGALAWLDRTREAREFGIAASGGLGDAGAAAEAALNAFLRQDSQPSNPAATLAALRQACGSWE
jgi:type III secretion protein N (ATPase)